MHSRLHSLCSCIVLPKNQWEVHGGKCGVCGDPWQGPRYHEAGGRFATGLVVRTYDAGDTIRTRVELTDNKLGWFEFRLCPHDDPTVRVQQSCLDTHLLRNPSNKTRFLVSYLFLSYFFIFIYTCMIASFIGYIIGSPFHFVFMCP